MDVFSLRDTVVREYEPFATSFRTIFAKDLDDGLLDLACAEIFRSEGDSACRK